MSIFGFITPSPTQILILLLLGVLLFGKRLPEIGKNIGKGLLEFKKGVNDLREGKVAKEEPKPMMEETVPEDAPKFESP